VRIPLDGCRTHQYIDHGRRRRDPLAELTAQAAGRLHPQL